jgi:hypothetical protein
MSDVGIDGEITLEWISDKQSGRMWTGFIWLRIETSGGFLYSQGLCSMDLVQMLSKDEILDLWHSKLVNQSK